ncbi:hypothetical protein MVEN_00673000 [Mycena venus]|uniref:Uncharacterized protein n=1 Tax=Mycena venus TaxID=2733690 RepID=A0A8H6YQV7_9AGAR|nr:hypothetical protein MVEN_00673000 [Mycena venus]
MVFNPITLLVLLATYFTLAKAQDQDFPLPPGACFVHATSYNFETLNVTKPQAGNATTFGKLLCSSNSGLMVSNDMAQHALTPDDAGKLIWYVTPTLSKTYSLQYQIGATTNTLIVDASGTARCSGPSNITNPNVTSSFNVTLVSYIQDCAFGAFSLIFNICTNGGCLCSAPGSTQISLQPPADANKVNCQWAFNWLPIVLGATVADTANYVEKAGEKNDGKITDEAEQVAGAVLNATEATVGQATGAAGNASGQIGDQAGNTLGSIGGVLPGGIGGNRGRGGSGRGA